MYFYIMMLIHIRKSNYFKAKCFRQRRYIQSPELDKPGMFQKQNSSEHIAKALQINKLFNFGVP